MARGKKSKGREEAAFVSPPLFFVFFFLFLSHLAEYVKAVIVVRSRSPVCVCVFFFFVRNTEDWEENATVYARRRQSAGVPMRTGQCCCCRLRPFSLTSFLREVFSFTLFPVLRFSRNSDRFFFCSFILHTCVLFFFCFPGFIISLPSFFFFPHFSSFTGKARCFFFFFFVVSFFFFFSLRF